MQQTQSFINEIFMKLKYVIVCGLLVSISTNQGHHMVEARDQYEIIFFTNTLMYSYNRPYYIDVWKPSLLSIAQCTSHPTSFRLSTNCKR